MTNNKLKRRIRNLLKDGVYCQHAIFKTIYPTYMGHYSVLRNTIAEVKDKGVK